MVLSYYVKQWALTGTMLGGVRDCQSSSFATLRQADQFLSQWLAANEEAERNVFGKIELSMLPPDILEDGSLA